MDWHIAWESGGPSDKLASISNIKEKSDCWVGVQEQEKQKLLYMRVIGARLVLPRESAVELILKWSSQQDSHS